MPAFEVSLEADTQSAVFPPVTREHILNCAYDHWFPKYRESCIRSRIISLPPEAVQYLNEDGILLADEDECDDDWQPSSAVVSGWAQEQHRLEDGQEEEGENEEEEEGEEEGGEQQQGPRNETAPRLPPNRRFPSLHLRIKDEIRVLGGAVAPKLNWSCPKDAAFISRHQNTIECRDANDVYLLLKSSSFVDHDLSHAFDGCVAPATPAPPGLGFKPVLVLRSFFAIRPSLEFRCFVKHRNLVAISQRDLKFYAFLDRYRPAIVARAKEMFDGKLKYTFPDGSFAFDIYVPEGDQGNGLARARLIDINPWAPRTDTLLFSWEELLTLHVPSPVLGVVREGGFEFDDAVMDEDVEGDKEGDDDRSDEDDQNNFEPELRLVEEDAPAVASGYSAHKLPKEVVDATTSGGGLRQFTAQWRDMMERRGNA